MVAVRPCTRDGLGSRPAATMEAMATDAELLAAWQGGDEASGNELVRRHFRSVSRYFRSKLGDDVQDLIQATFLDCVRYRDELHDGTGFRSFVLSVAHRRMVDEVRRRGRMPAFDPARDSLAASGLSPSTALVKDERARLLKRAIATLPLEQQVTLELFYWEQLRGKDIADVLGVSQHTVRSRLARAKDALKQAITELAEEPQLASETVEGLDTWAKRIAPDTD